MNIGLCISEILRQQHFANFELGSTHSEHSSALLIIIIITYPSRQLAYRAATKLIHPCLSLVSPWMLPRLWFIFSSTPLKPARMGFTSAQPEDKCATLLGEAAHKPFCMTYSWDVCIVLDPRTKWTMKIETEETNSVFLTDTKKCDAMQGF